LSSTATEIVWLNNEPQRVAACPICTDAGGKSPILRMRSLDAAARMLTLLACPDCESLFWDDLTPLAYETPGGAYDWATDFYVEQGAGIDALIEPIARLAGQPIKRALEIGCGYGFSLDAGRRLFGWDTHGVDPSPLAAAGGPALELPIEAIYATADSDFGGSFDLVYGSEVIEHVDHPDDFLRICRAHLAPDGILALTTPDAGGIRRETPLAMLLPALSPGHHLFLFSARGLIRILTRAGFGAVSVRTDGTRLIAYASDRPLGFDPSQQLDRALYRDYLRAVLKRDALPGSLEIGLRSRLFKELSHAGDFSAALAEFERLAALLERDRKIVPTLAAAAGLADSVERAGLSGGTGVPWGLPVVYFCRGMVELNHFGNHAAAVSWFDASVRLAEACRMVYAAAGIDDGETWVVMGQAKENAILALCFVDPDQVLERVERGGLSEPLIEAVFARLTDLGHAAQATRLEPFLANRDRWPVLGRIGLIRLLLSAPADAIEPLVSAFTLARAAGSGATDAESCQIKQREILARLLVQDAHGAARAAFELLDPAAGEWVSPSARAELEALLADHPAVRDLIKELAAESEALDGASLPV
jgi:SAM-dependent methyltransferase